MPDNITDISDKSFEDLIEADRNVLTDLAKERDDVDGRWSNEDIAKELLRLDGREDEIPDEYRSDDGENGDNEGEAEAEPDPEAEAADDEDDDFQPASEHSRVHEATFIADASIVGDWLDYIGTMVKEAKVHLSPTGITVRAVDPANVGMVETTLRAEAFESFNVHGDGIIGVNTNRLSDIIGAASAGDLVEIDYDTQTRHLVISYGGHTFNMALIDPDSIRAEPDLPDLDLPARVIIEDANDFNRSVDFSDSVSDHLSMAADPTPTLEFYAEGDTDDYTGTFEDGEEVTFEIIPDEEVRSLFSLDYLKDIKKPLTKGQTLTLDLGHEFPMRLTTEIVNDDDNAVGNVVFMLAPRIQSE